LLVSLEFSSDELRVDFENLQPKSLSLLDNSMLVCPEQRLLIDFVAECIVEEFGDKQKIPQCDIAVYKLYGTAHD